MTSRPWQRVLWQEEWCIAGCRWQHQYGCSVRTTMEKVVIVGWCRQNFDVQTWEPYSTYEHGIWRNSFFRSNNINNTHHHDDNRFRSISHATINQMTPENIHLCTANYEEDDCTIALFLSSPLKTRKTSTCDLFCATPPQKVYFMFILCLCSKIKIKMNVLFMFEACSKCVRNVFGTCLQWRISC